MPCNKCPVALVSTGIGVTPMVSMLHALAAEGGDRPVWFVQGVRDGGHSPLAREVRDSVVRSTGIQVDVAYSRPRPKDETGIDHDSERAWYRVLSRKRWDRAKSSLPRQRLEAPAVCKPPLTY
ncbi:MAG: hypothetical protein V3W06_06275 [Acidimicrobiia bacterium]